MENSTHTCLLSRCTVKYNPEEMIYTVVSQCKFCGKLNVVHMNSDCVHDFLKAVTMGY